MCPDNILIHAPEKKTHKYTIEWEEVYVIGKAWAFSSFFFLYLKMFLFNFEKTHSNKMCFTMAACDMTLYMCMNHVDVKGETLNIQQ